MNRIKLAALLTAGLALPVLGGAAAVYETGFEASGDPSGTAFTVGDLDGQGGWAVLESTASIAADAGAHQGGQYVVQDPASSIDFAMDGSGLDSIFIEAYHQGPGAAAPQLPPDDPAASAVIAFKSTGVDTYTISCLDGDGTGNTGASYVDGGVNYQNDSWTRIVLRVDYTNEIWDCLVDGSTYLSNLGFRDSGVTQFNGFRSTTESGSFLDTFSIMVSTGDLDGDGFDDVLEIEQDSDPTNSGDKPLFGDVNRSGAVNSTDAILLYRIVMGTIINSGQYDTFDVNMDSQITVLDARLLYLWAINSSEVPTLPVR
ncbi:dockerin type I repeat-containing protein [bacterium]|nr:dockerin type I repeat-containing protein [bacterium]